MRKLKNKKLWEVIAVAIIFSVFGFLVGKLFNIFPFIKVGNEFELFDVFSLLATGLLAYYVSISFSKKNNINISEKEILYSHIDQLSQITIETAEIVALNNVNYSEIVNRLKKIHKYYKRLIAVAEKVNLPLDQEKFLNFSNQFKTTRIVITSSPSSYAQGSSLANAGQNINNGIIQYSQVKLRNIDLEFDKLSDCLFDIRLEVVNKCQV